MDIFPTYSAAKYYDDVWLERNDLDYTIIRPWQLINDSETGKVTVANDLEHKNISRADFATAIMASLDNEQTIGKAFDMIGGDTPIVEALKTL